MQGKVAWVCAFRQEGSMQDDLRVAAGAMDPLSSVGSVPGLGFRSSWIEVKEYDRCTPEDRGTWGTTW